MTQVTTHHGQAGPAPAQAPGAPLPERSPGQSSEVAAGRRIPRQLERLRTLSVGVVLGFTALTLLQLILGAQALRAAAGDTDQLVRVQNIKVNLLRADALATNAFLVGGLESPAQRAQYDESLTAVTREIAAAAEAQPLDRDVLAELNALVTDYAEGMAQARTANRQGLPVGAGYLRASSTELRDRGVTLVDALVKANTDRAAASLGAHLPMLVALPAVAALVFLGLANQWIARRFRRRVNTGLAAAAGLVLLLGLVAVLLSGVQASMNAKLRSGAYATAVNGAEVRSAANAARTNESLRLISRGSGAAYEQAWKDNADRVSAAMRAPELADAPAETWQRYYQGHEEMVALEQNGDWDGAVARATAQGPDTPSVTFAQFDEEMRRIITAGADRTTASLRGQQPAFFVVSALTLLGGLAAAALAARGVTTRLKEYG